MPDDFAQIPMDKTKAIEFQALLDGCVWSPWFLLALCLPALILIPCGFCRCRLVFWGIPIAYVASWIGFAIACQSVADEQMRIADQFGTSVSDTGLTFAPFFYGTPFAGVVTLFTSAIAIGLFSRPDKIDNDLPAPRLSASENLNKPYQQ